MSFNLILKCIIYTHSDVIFSILILFILSSDISSLFNIAINNSIIGLSKLALIITNLLIANNLLSTSIKLIKNILPYEETFVGSNYKKYSHKYFVAFVDDDVIPSQSFQEFEVSDMKWFTYEEAMNSIREYSVENRMQRKVRVDQF